MSHSLRQLLSPLALIVALLFPQVLAAQTQALEASPLEFSVDADKCILEVSVIGGELYHRIDYQVFGDGKVTHTLTAMNGEVAQSAAPGTYIEQKDFAELKSSIVESSLYLFTEAAMQRRLVEAGRRPIRISGAPWAQITIRLDRIENKASGASKSAQEYRIEMIGAGATANLSSDIPEYAAAAKLFRALSVARRDHEREASQ